MDKLAELVTACRREGLPVTVQRRVILEALAGRDDHPTADQVYAQVRGRLPNVSRTTVYRVLETLVALGVARKTASPGAAARFDPRTHRHHHLVCSACEAIVDVHDPALDGLRLGSARRAGFDVEDYSVHFRGLCPKCRRQRRR